MIDFISDLHTDFWLPFDPDIPKRGVEKWIEGLLPESPSKILLIGGDIGHWNIQNTEVLRVLSRYYEKIIWTHGNHDLYLINYDIQKKYDFNSFKRLDEMIELGNRLVGVSYIQNELLHFDGLNIACGSGWYDGSLGLEKGISPSNIMKRWQYLMNDSNYIFPSKEYCDDQGFFNFQNYAEEQKKKLYPLLSEADIVLTHVQIGWNQKQFDEYTEVDTFYHSKAPDKLHKRPRVWIFGHRHTRFTFTRNNQFYVCNPLGYPTNHSHLLAIDQKPGNKIITLE